MKMEKADVPLWDVGPFPMVGLMRTSLDAYTMLLVADRRIATGSSSRARGSDAKDIATAKNAALINVERAVSTLAVGYRVRLGFPENLIGVCDTGSGDREVEAGFLTAAKNLIDIGRNGVGQHNQATELTSAIGVDVLAGRRLEAALRTRKRSQGAYGCGLVRSQTGSEQVGNRDRSDNGYDRHNDHQLNQCKTFVASHN